MNSVTHDRPGAQGRLAVVGGGVIGLTCALAAADNGWRVTVFDAGEQFRAAWVAGGMLGCLGEGDPGEDALLAVAEQSVRRWPALIRRLGDASVVTAQDSLFVATTAADSAHLRRLAEYVWSVRPRAAGDLHTVDTAALRDLEPALGPRVRTGYRACGEGAVDNRRLLDALRRALGAAGAHVVHRRIDDLAEITDADQVLLAAGAGVPALWPTAPIHLDKGEVLRLRASRVTLPPPRHVIRARVDGRTVYLVPRHDGIVIGATQYEGDVRDWHTGDRSAEAGGVADLLADAIEVFPGLRDYTLLEASAGFRPCSADGLPIIERLDARTVVAAGHGRNGIVLAPFTSDAVMALMDAGANGSATADAGAKGEQ